MSSDNNRLAPVVAFAYNRADKIIRCLETLEQNEEAKDTDLIIYSDGPKNPEGKAEIDETRKALHEYEKRARFASVEVIEAPVNRGLATSIMTGVTQTLEKYGRVIVIEDDLLVSKSFLKYMNGALNFYQDNPKIGAISGYTYPLEALDTYTKDIYMMHKGDCWGWATWKDRWNSAKWSDINFEAYLKDKPLRRKLENTENGWDLLMILLSEGRTSSWAIRWVLYLLQNDLWTVYPSKSLVTNAGFDGSGIHSNKFEEVLYYRPLEDNSEDITFEALTPDRKLEKEAAVHPRKGFVNGSVYFLKRIYVHIYNLRHRL